MVSTVLRLQSSQQDAGVCPPRRSALLGRQPGTSLQKCRPARGRGQGANEQREGGFSVGPACPLGWKAFLRRWHLNRGRKGTRCEFRGEEAPGRGGVTRVPLCRRGSGRGSPALRSLPGMGGPRCECKVRLAS